MRFWIWEFPKIGAPNFGVLIIRILLLRVLYWVPLFSETPISGPGIRVLGAGFEFLDAISSCRSLGLEALGERLVHGWDRLKNVRFNSLLGLSTHENVKCYPAMVKERSMP